jgi:hypothetical protein
VTLNWKNFVAFYELVISCEEVESYAIEHYLDLTYFFESWSSYKKHRFVPLVGLEWMPPSVWKLGPREAKTKISLPMQWESLQQCTRGAPLTNCTPSHLNVPRKRHNEVSSTNCED